VRYRPNVVASLLWSSSMKIKTTTEDKMFSEYIRKRALKRCGGCERCHAPKTSYKELQCAHVFSRRHKSTRWDEDNAYGLCFGCHQYFGENPLEYMTFAKNELGSQRFEILRLRHETTQKMDIGAVSLYLKQLLEGV